MSSEPTPDSRPAPIDLDGRVDPAFAEALAAKPKRMVERLDQVPRARELLAASRPPGSLPAGVEASDHRATASDGHEIHIRLYRPAGGVEPLPVLFWIHGGGLMFGSVAMDEGRSGALVAETGAAVASVEYRLAPEHPFPTPLEDCYAGLCWVAEQGAELGLDPDRLAIGGASAGGGLAAGLALLARDRGGPRACFQLLRYPMLDDRNQTASSHAQTDPRAWNRSANALGWSAYLGEAAGGPEVSHHAAPARCADPAGLPPAVITVGDLDLFLDEDVAYAQALGRAGVPVELHVYPGAYHGAINDGPEAELTRRWYRDEADALARAFARATTG